MGTILTNKIGNTLREEALYLTLDQSVIFTSNFNVYKQIRIVIKLWQVPIINLASLLLMIRSDRI